MMNSRQRLERLEAAVKASSPEPARLHFLPGLSKKTKIRYMMLALRDIRSADDSVTEEELRARAVRLVESGRFDPPSDAAARAAYRPPSQHGSGAHEEV